MSFSFSFFIYLSQVNNDKEILRSSLTIDNEQGIRLIIQYHYTKCKDMDLLTHSHTLIHLIHDINQQQQKKN